LEGVLGRTLDEGNCKPIKVLTEASICFSGEQFVVTFLTDELLPCFNENITFFHKYF
jgi:hypothetical protein